MTFHDIVKMCRGLESSEERNINDYYGEFVILNKQMGDWNTMLSSIFGDPIKAQGDDPSREMVDITEQYGGIRRDQVLYRTDTTDGTAIAMLWPWQDSVHITIKLALLKDSWG